MYLTQYHLTQIGFKKLGKNVLVSDKASIYRPENIVIGDNCRLDDFCILSAGDGGIGLGNNVHIGCQSTLIGKGKILIDDFTEISGKVSIYSSTNDYHADSFGTWKERINIISGDVLIGKHVVVGSGSIILPDVVIEDGGRVGALSLVTINVKANSIYAGIPSHFIKNRHDR